MLESEPVLKEPNDNRSPSLESQSALTKLLGLRKYPSLFVSLDLSFWSCSLINLGHLGSTDAGYGIHRHCTLIAVVF